MAKQDVRQALMAMDGDDAVRARLADGDFDAVDGLELSAEEQMLVRDAASELPEVSGFAFDSFLMLDGIKGESTDDKHKGEIELQGLPLKLQLALKYTLGR